MAVKVCQAVLRPSLFLTNVLPLWLGVLATAAYHTPDLARE